MEAAEHIFDGEFADVLDEPEAAPQPAAKAGSSRKARMIVRARHCHRVTLH